MRLFEFFLILEAFIVVLWTFSNRRIRSKSMLTFIFLITFSLHYFIEGLRWQMVFVYGVCLLAVLLNLTRWKNNIYRKTILISTLLLIILSGILCVLVPIFELPRFSSKYSVGTYDLKLQERNGQKRTISVKFWFPTTQEEGAYCKYLQDQDGSLDGLMGMPNFVFGHLNLVETRAYHTMKVVEESTKFPLVVYSHGAASTNLDNTALLQEIAGNGYIVMAIDHDFSFERYGLKKSDATTLTLDAQKKFIKDLVQKVVPNQVNDVLFSLQNIQSKDFFLADHINFDQVALIGHSLGGTTATVAGVEHQSIKSVINIDGPVSPEAVEKLDLPMLYMSSFNPELPDAILEEKGLPNVKLYKKIKKLELEGVKKLVEKNAIASHWVRFKNAGHLDFTDIPFIVPVMTTKGYDKQKGHALKSRVIIDFLNFGVKESHTFKKQNDHSLEWIK